jgi:Beta propeller domain
MGGVGSAVWQPSMRKGPLAATVLMGLVAALVALPAEAAAAKGAPRAANVRLKAFRSCTGLLRYARRQGLRTLGRRGTGPRPLGDPVPLGEARPRFTDTISRPGMPAPAVPPALSPTRAGGSGDDFSRTNVQEAGIDEPDVVKTDGSRLFAISRGTLHAVDVRAETPRLLGSLPLDQGWGHQLLLHQDRVLVLSNVRPEATLFQQSSGSAPIYRRRGTLLAEVDVSDPAAMRVVRTLTVDGTFGSARLKGATARVVTSSAPRALGGPSPGRRGDTGRAKARRRAAIRRSRLSGWMPSSVLEDRRTGHRVAGALTACRGVRRPGAFSGLNMLAVLTIDLSKGLEPVDSDGLMADAQTVYASPRSLYVASRRSIDRRGGRLHARTSTAIHKFDVSRPDRAEYRASGKVLGSLLNQFSLSEHRGFLRVASTTVPPWWDPDPDQESESFVTVLGERSGRLVKLGRVGDLGRGERIYAVRFLENVAYVVTFRETDPLYTVSLAKPARPKVLGALKIRGYSAYLHPVGENLLLGVGQDATARGETRGTQLSLFDVSNLRKPVRLRQRALGSDSSSEAEYDHHAFLYWPATRLAVMPVEDYRKRFTGAIGFRIDPARGIDEVGRVSHGDDSFDVPVGRSLVVGDRLYTVSVRGVKASDLETLADRGWMPFR